MQQPHIHAVIQQQRQLAVQCTAACILHTQQQRMQGRMQRGPRVMAGDAAGGGQAERGASARVRTQSEVRGRGISKQR